MKFAILLATILSVALAKTSPRFGFPEENPPWARVVNGQEAKRNEAPYIVSLTPTPTGSHFCGGSILTEKLVLTAAHCLQPSMYVHAGLHDRNQKGDGQTVKVLKTIKHDGYAGGVGPNDIALLILSEPLNFDGKTIGPISLPEVKEQYNGIKCTVFGWGKDTPNGGLPNNLMTVTTDLLNAQECTRQLPGGAPITSTMVCSGSSGKHISVCNGDSGGPLVINNDGRLEQVGIVSWVYIPCGQAGYPSVYTCTISHSGWIAEKRAMHNV